MPRRFLILPVVLLLAFGTASALDGSHHLEAGVLASVYREERGNLFSLGGAAAWYYNPLFSIQGDGVGVGIWTGFGVPRFKNGYGLLVHVMAGPVFTVWQKDQFTVPVGIGFYVNEATTADGIVLGAGVGVNLSFQWQFSSLLYGYGRMQGAWTFHGRGELVISPSIGIGFVLGKGSRNEEG